MSRLLDRAFVVEFWAVDLDTYPRRGQRPLEPIVLLTLERGEALVEVGPAALVALSGAARPSCNPRCTTPVTA